MAPTTLLLSLLLASPAPQGAEPQAFEAYLWRGEPEPAHARTVLETLGGTLVPRGEALTPLLDRGLELVLFNAAGRDELHLERERAGYRERWQRWYDTREDALLVRSPCLTDPVTLQRLEATLAAALDRDGVARLRGLSLGDEVGLTAHGAPEDLCLSPTCRAAWRRFLAEADDVDEQEARRYADPAEHSTDATRLALASGRTEALRPWLLRRRFHELVVRSLLERLGARARALAPGVPVGLLGIQAQSPFGTPRLELALADLDFAEAYREVDARELLLTLRTPGQRALLTVFPTPDRPDLATWSVWEHWLRGGDGVVVWSDAVLSRSEELRQATVAAVRSVRSVDERVPAFAPRPAGAAVVHDFESLCVRWLRDALLDGPTWPRRFASHQAATGSWETALAAWLRLLADCGIQPGSLPLQAVDAASTERFGLLVLSELCVLDADEVLRLERYLEAGGTLVVSGQLGWVDSRGRRPAVAPLERLERLAPERVLALEDRVAHYPLERARRTPRARAWRERARAWLARAGIETAPWSLVGALEELPWLCAWSTTDDGVLVGAALPDWADVEGQGPLTELAVEVRPRGGRRLEWVHPPLDPELEARVLAPGQAAVFRLLPPAGR